SPGGTVSSLPPIAGSVPQVRIIRVISKSKASGSGDKATTGEGTASGSGIVAVSPDNAGSSSPIVTETVPQVRIIRVISKSRASGSGINVTSDAASSGGGVVVSPDGTKSSLPSITGSVPQTRVISESKISGDSSKCAEGTGSGSSAIDFTRHLAASLPRIKFQHELSSQPESSLSPVTETVSQGRLVSKGKTSEGSSKCADACSTATLTHSSVISSARLRSELSHQSETHLRSLLLFEGKRNQPSRRFVKLLSCRDQPANLPDIVAVSTSDNPTSNYSDFGPLVGEVSTSESGPQSQHEMQLVSLSGECFSRISADVSVSTLEGDASDLRALEDGASSSASDSVVAVSPSSVSAFAPLSAPEPLSA
ncbi:hypothetical protein, partial [Candidatus Ichthyocystis sparus]|uniref:hypothetical protein n=1 Tax=Candidatus Ichthyocystis sparus TaxID=1561004 RepID=UPI00159EE097